MATSPAGWVGVGMYVSVIPYLGMLSMGQNEENVSKYSLNKLWIFYNSMVLNQYYLPDIFPSKKATPSFLENLLLPNLEVS